MSDTLKIRNLTLAECKIDTHEWMRLYIEGKHDELAVRMLEILRVLHKSENCSTEIDVSGQYFIDIFCQNISFYFVQSNFVITNEFVKIQLISFNVLVQNLFWLSSFGSTDAFVKMLLYLLHNLPKLLTLYNARCSVDIPYDALFA